MPGSRTGALDTGAADGTPMPSGTVKRWLGLVAGVVAPTTLVTALLLYFGYVAARKTYAYFGLDVDLIGFTTQDLVMRSPQPLLVPLVVLLLLGAGLYAANAAWRRHLAVAPDDRGRAQVRGLLIAGAAVLAAGVALLLGYPVFGSWRLYPLATPVVLGCGAGLVAWAAATGAHLRPRRAATAGPDGRAGAVVALALVVVTCLFWSTATIAEWSGLAVAQATARDLGALPAVVLDTGERLSPRNGVVTEERLPGGPDATYHYRYRGLRLLVQGDERLFLVPEEWTPSGSTYVVPFDETVRLRFRFVNDPP